MAHKIVENVAKAIYEAQFGAEIATPFEKLQIRQTYFNQAIAAINALKDAFRHIEGPKGNSLDHSQFWNYINTIQKEIIK